MPSAGVGSVPPQATQIMTVELGASVRHRVKEAEESKRGGVEELQIASRID